MRQILLIFSLFCASYMTVNAQTNTWTGAGANANWNTVANWSLNTVPTAADDVIIPTGSTVIINVSSFVKSIVVQGSSTLTMSQSLSFTNASSFSANTTVNWNNNSFYGGGTLTNNGTVNLTTSGTRYISGATTVINNGIFTMPSGGYLRIYDTAVFNNASNGVFDIQSESVIDYNGNEAHNFNNQGLLKKSSGDGTAYIDCYLSNSGTITVESGTLNMRRLDKTFNGGTYNVTAEKILLFSSKINVSGTLKGVLNGSLYWTGNVSVAKAATFNFTGTTQVQWANSSLIGGGVLTNASNISLVTSGTRHISLDTRLNNTGIITMPDGGYLRLYDTSILNNQSTGVFDIKSASVIDNSGSKTHNFNNQGLLKKSSSDGTAYIDCYLSNTGTIAVESGTLNMRRLDKTFNGGTYNVTTESFLSFSSQVNISGTLKGVLNGPLYWAGNVSVANAATFNFTGNTQVHWANSSLIGGGVLTNASNLSLVTSGTRYISLGTRLTNTGLITMPNGGYLRLVDTSILDNQATGVFDIQSDAVIDYSGALAHNFNNLGLLRKSSGDGTAYIDCYLSNTGTITVESGTLNMRRLAKTFNGGTYNVTAGKFLSFSSQINVSDTLTGALDGSLYWASNVSVASTATFNFTGTTPVQWANSSLIGGGVLTNASKLSLVTSGTRYISSGTKLNNTGLITMPDGGYLRLVDTSVLNNQATGVFDIQSAPVIDYSGALAHNFNNLGLLKKSAGTGTAYIDSYLSNSGTISADSGTLNLRSLAKTNTTDGIIKGTATIVLPPPASFTNDGTFAPGGSPGTLTALGTYKSSATSVLDVELNGLVQDTEYDLLAITGTNAVFEGKVNVSLGFEPNVGDSFSIAMVSGTIATKKLVSPLYVDYGCKQYTFKISYPNDKAVVLTITAKKDVLPPEVITKTITVQLDATGKVSITPSQINNGSTDNCTSQKNLVFTLDITNFTCAKLGDNTVKLTVKDEAGNSASETTIVTVKDVTPPTVTCPKDQTIDVNALDYVLPDYFVIGGLSASDNCSFTVVQTPLEGTNLTHGVHNIAFKVTDASGNVKVCNFNLTVNDLSLGIEDHDLENSVLLYPNPVRNILTIKNMRQQELLSAVIVDITGKTISTINLEHMGLTKEVSMESYVNGMYFVKIKGLSGSVTKRMIKE